MFEYVKSLYTVDIQYWYKGKGIECNSFSNSERGELFDLQSLGPLIFTSLHKINMSRQKRQRVAIF